jgi:hypothetical protein
MPLRRGTFDLRISIPPVLNVGEYSVGIWFGSNTHVVLDERGATSFRLNGSDRDRPDRAVALDLPTTVEEVQVK